MSDDDNDWLDIGPTIPVREAIKQDPKFAEMVEHTKTLTAQQRNFIACFAAAHYDPVLACRKYRELFKRDLKPRQLSKWMQDDPDFLKAIAMREEIAARATGASVARTLSILQEISRRNFLGRPMIKDGEPVLDADGAPVLVPDDRAAMQALELVGKHLKMFKPDEAQGAAPRMLPAFFVGVNIAVAETKIPAIDVQVSEVPRDNPND